MLITMETGASGGGGEYKRLHIGTPSSETVNLGESYSYLYISQAYSNQLCACEWDSSDASNFKRYYGGNDATTIALPQTASAGIKSVDPANGTFAIAIYASMKNVEVFYK